MKYRCPFCRTLYQKRKIDNQIHLVCPGCGRVLSEYETKRILNKHVVRRKKWKK